MSESQFLLSRKENVIGLAWAKYPLLVQSAMNSKSNPCKTNMAARTPPTCMVYRTFNGAHNIHDVASTCSLLVI